MKLSVIIVSYRVQYFLEQCLCSVSKAMAAGNFPDTEVMVVDNHSSDDTLAYLQPKFPFVQFIASQENLGFGKANNLAWRICKGEYVLFLNPDTIVPEDCFRKCVAFMDAHTDAGALGIRMVDGSGQYLKESKRGFPSPWVSFCKMSGLTGLFPASKRFARYYLGHLSDQKTQPVDVLAGAFMLVRRAALEKTGGFDEQFFMYAEDIDLSYRIQQEGYQNYYFADSTIIHFKGESTRKDARYVQLFYKAMIQFVRKHFRGAVSWWYVKLLELAISAKARLHAGQNNTATPHQAAARAAILGDKKTASDIDAAFANRNELKIVNDPQQANLLLFCEGPGFTFREMIAQIEHLPPGKKAFIHGSGTGSIVGSHSRDNQGQVFIV